MPYSTHLSIIRIIQIRIISSRFPDETWPKHRLPNQLYTLEVLHAIQTVSE